MPHLHVKLLGVARQVRQISRLKEMGRVNEARNVHGKMIPNIREIGAQIAKSKRSSKSPMEMGRLTNVLGYLARGGSEITTWSVSHQRKLRDLSFCYKYPELEDLDASYTGISSDHDVMPLTACKILKFLRVDHTKLHSMRVLKKLITLEVLCVHKGQFSAAQIKDFKKAVPKCSVICIPHIKIKEDVEPAAEPKKMIMPGNELFIEDPGSFNPDPD